MLMVSVGVAALLLLMVAPRDLLLYMDGYVQTQSGWILCD